MPPCSRGGRALEEAGRALEEAGRAVLCSRGGWHLFPGTGQLPRLIRLASQSRSARSARGSEAPLSSR